MTIRTLSVAAFMTHVATAPAAGATIAEALDAYRDNHVADAERMFTAIAADTTANEADRAEALRELGRIDFLVRGGTDALAAALAHATSGEARCALAVTALQTYREAGTPERGLAAGDGALGVCNPSGAETVHIESARAHLALAAAHPDARALHLSAASADLAAIAEVARGAPEVAGARFSLGMAQRDATAAFQAWQDYYWLTDVDAPRQWARI